MDVGIFVTWDNCTVVNMEELGCTEEEWKKLNDEEKEDIIWKWLKLGNLDMLLQGAECSIEFN